MPRASPRTDVTSRSATHAGSLIRDRERYRLDRSRIRIDLDELDRLLATTGDAERERHALETALSLWHGQPLAGSDYPWEGFIHQLHATLLDLLGRVGTGSGRSRAASDVGADRAAGHSTQPPPSSAAATCSTSTTQSRCWGRQLVVSGAA